MPVSVNAIDHFVIRVTDLDAAEALYRRLGFALTPRGFHAGRGSANHTAPFSGGNYFELIHLPDGATRTRFTAITEGPVAAVLRPADSPTVHAELRALGYEVPEPRDLTRPVELPEGIRDARFITVDFPEIPPELVIFVTCEHLTPDLVWRPEWEDHPNGARRVSNLFIVHPAPQDLGATFCRLFGSGTVRVDDSGVVLSLGPKTGSQDTITILTPEAFAARYPSAEIPVDLSRGWFAGATFDVTSLDRVKSALLAGGISFDRTPSGTIAVPPAAAGALLEFRAA